jgi:hypothetical protein
MASFIILGKDTILLDLAGNLWNKGGHLRPGFIMQLMFHHAIDDEAMMLRILFDGEISPFVIVET